MATLIITDSPRPFALALLCTGVRASSEERRALYLTDADRTVPRVALEEALLSRVLVKFLDSQESLRTYLAAFHTTLETPLAVAIDAVKLNVLPPEEVSLTLALVANLVSVVPPTTKVTVLSACEDKPLRELWQVYSRFFAEIYILKRVESMAQLYSIECVEGDFELRTCREPVYSAVLDKLH
jgi:hypothetical protein